MAAGNTGRRERGTRRYRRRRPMPALIAGMLLCIAVVVVWVTVIDGSTKQAASITCTPPPSGTGGTVLDPAGLDTVRPLPAGDVPVRVLNASKERGEAGIVSASLNQLGFTRTAEPGNDPRYAKSTMDCRGQIRFGSAGESAARTVSLLDPCSQLVRDNRKDGSVDMVIGDKFDDLRPNDAARNALRQIGAAPNAAKPGQAAAADEVGVDPNLLRAARDRTNCG